MRVSLAAATCADAERRVRAALDATSLGAGQRIEIVQVAGVTLGVGATGDAWSREPPLAKTSLGLVALDGVGVGRAVAELAGALFADGDAHATLTGEFALLGVDARTGALALSRDRLGARSLFYARHEGGWLVSTEPRGLFAAGLPRAPDERALAQWLVEEHAERRRTVFSGVLPVPAGYAVRLGDAAREERWFFPERARREARPDPEARDLRGAFEASVLARARGARRVGVFLSGGLDSASVAGAATAVARRHGLPLPLLATVRFPGLPCDEGPRAEHVARSLGLHLESVTAPADPEAYELSDLAPGLLPDPVGVLYREMAARLHAQGADLVLTGLGSDDLQWAGGSPVIDAWHEGVGAALATAGVLEDPWDRGAWSRLVRAVPRAVAPRTLARLRPMPLWDPPWLTGRARSLVAEGRRELAADAAPFESFPASRATWLRSLVLGLQIPFGLGEATRMGRAMGAELAHPFADARVVSYFLERSIRDRVHPRIEKPLVHAAARAWLPDGVLAERSIVEFSSFFRPIWAHHLARLGSDWALVELGLVDPAGLAALRRDPAHLDEPRTLGALVMAERLARGALGRRALG